MTTLLIKHAYLVTLDDHQREIPDGGLFIRDGFIEQVGPSASLPQTADEILDLSGHVLLPGLVNTHHHFYQTLTRAIPAAQDANLFNWLKTLYPIWARLTPEDIFTSTQTALAELALSGGRVAHRAFEVRGEDVAHADGRAQGQQVVGRHRVGDVEREVAVHQHAAGAHRGASTACSPTRWRSPVSPCS